MPADDVPSPSRLPGVGAALEIADATGARVQLVRRNTGELVAQWDGHAPLELDALNTRLLGAFASGQYGLTLAAAARLEDVIGGLLFDLVRVAPDAHVVGHSIQQLQVRRRTGVSIVAVLRGPVALISPDPSTILRAADDLLIACREGDHDPFVRYLQDGH